MVRGTGWDASGRPVQSKWCASGDFPATVERRFHFDPSCSIDNFISDPSCFGDVQVGLRRNLIIDASGRPVRSEKLVLDVSFTVSEVSLLTN